MKNKKNIAMAMAAVSTLGAVAPAFANGVQTLAFDANEIDVMLASGYEIDEEVYERTDIYNTNGTKDRSDDTLKNEFKDDKIVVSKENEEDSYLDQFVVAKKVEDIARVNEAKSYVETAKTLITQAKEDGATVKVENKAAEITDRGTYNQSMVTVTVTPKEVTDENPEKVYKFIGAEGIVSDEEQEEEVTAAELLKIFEDLNLEKLDLAKKSQYDNINLVKYTIEKNIEKFDIVKEESGEQNADLDVTLYIKGTETEVITITFKNFTEVKEDLIINMPKLENTDFNGHWAQEQILESMFAGHIDAVEKFRPQDGITRAEFAKIACKLFEIEYEEGQIEPFSDVTKEDGWKYEYITALYNTKVNDESVVQGDGEKFRPDDRITRQEVAVILAKLTEDELKTGEELDVTKEFLVGYDKDGNKIKETRHTDVITKFLDDKDIANWADNSVKYLNEKVEYDGKPVAQGNENKFNPTQDITRAEALVMVQRASQANEVVAE